MTVAATLSPGSIFADYRVDTLIARGGMGVIYQATEFQPQRTVALKVVAPELAADDGFRTRFVREAQTAASIEHPNVIPVLRVGEEDGMLFIAMRFIAGRDLATLIAEEGPVDPMRAARIVDQIADALDTAHGQGLVHRDVKPANVLIERRQRGEHAYLTDFGLTKSLAATGGLTQTGLILGTADYMAPEQWEGGRVDARTDVYSLGCVLYEALTARVPFVREGQAARMYAHLRSAPPSLSEVIPGQPARLDPVVARAMAKTPGERYPSAGDFGTAALAAAEGRSITRVERSVATGEAAPAEYETIRLRPVADVAALRGAATTKLASTIPMRPRTAPAAAEPPSGPRTAAVAEKARSRRASAPIERERTVPTPPRPPARPARSGNPVVVVLLAVAAAVGLAVAIVVATGSASHQQAATHGQSPPASNATPRLRLPITAPRCATTRAIPNCWDGHSWRCSPTAMSTKA